MLKRYGDKALEQSRTRIDELASDGDHDGADTWRRITTAVEQLANESDTHSGAGLKPFLAGIRRRERVWFSVTASCKAHGRSDW